MVSLRPKSADLVAVLGLSLSVVGLYAGSLNLWWTWDDFFNLRQVLTRSVSDALFSSSYWRSLPHQLFTPLLPLSYELDVALFDLWPRAFYVHHLLGLVLCAIALYLLLRLWLESALAFLGALLFVVGVPVVTVAQQLMLRHYVEGLVFALLAIAAFVISIRRQKDDARG